ncbi:cell wall-associated NlpC family hydrolase [Stakelama sediminis]|uniref:Cell wall-associated NlpC family hydrolase n=1 Tax=Stakelama sediminis TaxID=463200 RepID=A0A840YXU5_9SPHN|nr:cell wall-associated NlpC family hydrolase [Stakelama sediminis]
MYRTLSRSAPLRDGTGAEAPILSEVLCGEGFELLELVGDQAWGIAQVDRSVGYIPADALQDPIAATHIVIQPNAHVNAADGSVIHTLPMGARVAAEINGAQAMLQDGGVMESKALTSLTGKRSGDYVAVAESLVGISGKTGGRSGEGVNCTGLVFLALEIAGISAPRFCDVQAAELGIPLEEGTALQRGDLIFFANHVVMLTDSDHVIHAVADSLPVTIESIDAVIGSGRFGPVVAQRRIGA